MSRWRPGATPRAKGCLLLWSWRTSPFHAKVSTSVASEWIKGCVFVTMLNTEMFWRNRGVRVRVLFFFAYYSGVVTAFVMARMRFILCLFTCLLVLAASQCFMWACVCLLVFIGSQWVEQSSWPHFLLLLTDRHLVPRLQRLDSAWRSVVSLLATTAWFVIGSFGSLFFVLFFLNPSYCDSVLVDNEVRTCLYGLPRNSYWYNEPLSSQSTWSFKKNSQICEFHKDFKVTEYSVTLKESRG